MPVRGERPEAELADVEDGSRLRLPAGPRSRSRGAARSSRPVRARARREARRPARRSGRRSATRSSRGGAGDPRRRHRTAGGSPFCVRDRRPASRAWPAAAPRAAPGPARPAREHPAGPEDLEHVEEVAGGLLAAAAVGIGLADRLALELFPELAPVGRAPESGASRRGGRPARQAGGCWRRRSGTAAPRRRSDAGRQRSRGARARPHRPPRRPTGARRPRSRAGAPPRSRTPSARPAPGGFRSTQSSACSTTSRAQSARPASAAPAASGTRCCWRCSSQIGFGSRPEPRHAAVSQASPESGSARQSGRPGASTRRPQKRELAGRKPFGGAREIDVLRPGRARGRSNARPGRPVARVGPRARRVGGRGRSPRPARPARQGSSPQPVRRTSGDPAARTERTLRLAGRNSAHGARLTERTIRWPFFDSRSFSFDLACRESRRARMLILTTRLSQREGSRSR